MNTTATSEGNVCGSHLGVLGPVQTSLGTIWYLPGVRLLPPFHSASWGQTCFFSKDFLLHLCVVTRKGASLHSQQPKTSSPHPQHGSQSGKVEERWRGAESRQRSLSHLSGEQGHEYVQYLQSRSTCKSQQKKLHTLVLDETKSASELLCDWATETHSIHGWARMALVWRWGAYALPLWSDGKQVQHSLGCSLSTGHRAEGYGQLENGSVAYSDS